MKPNNAELENRFLYHPPPNPGRVEDHARVSNMTLDLAFKL